MKYIVAIAIILFFLIGYAQCKLHTECDKRGGVVVKGAIRPICIEAQVLE